MCEPNEIVLSLVCPTLHDPSEFINELITKAENVKPSNSLNTINLWKKIELVIVSPEPFNLAQFKDYRLTQVKDEKNGIYRALNAGIEQASGTYVLVMNIDDFINLAKAIEVIEKHQNRNPDAIYGDTILKDDTQDLQIHITGSVDPMTIRKARMPASHQSQLIARREYLELNCFETHKKFFFFKIELKYASDFDFYCRSIKSNGSWILDSTLIAYQKMGGTTSRYWLRTTLEIIVISLLHRNDKFKSLPSLARNFAGAIRFHAPRQRHRKRVTNEK